MTSQPAVPLWLWRAVTRSLGVGLLGVATLATALYFGLADPPRAGPLLWQEEFTGDLSRWQPHTSAGSRLAAQEGGLAATFSAPGQTAWALTDAPPGPFTLEIAAAQTKGESGSVQYGLVWGWGDDSSYSAILVNGNGYAEAYQVGAGARTDWFRFAQWPHLLYGAEANRVRVDVRGAAVSVRLNDELFLEEKVASFSGRRLGVLARSNGPGRVVFRWVRVWAAR